ncbi:IS66 family transposase [Rhizobium leguminosarum]|uniref:IS66 family transposase n=1 Tax=Rhizobium leguminosarum TaxID=384 RepID=UPI003F97BA77
MFQVDGYAGYNRTRSCRFHHLACLLLAHACQKPEETTRSGSTPGAEDGVQRIGKSYWIKAKLRGHSAEARFIARQRRSAPSIADMRTVHAASCPCRGQISAWRSFSLHLKMLRRPGIFLTDGRIKIGNIPVERTMRSIPSNARMRSSSGTTREGKPGDYRLAETNFVDEVKK